MFVFVLITYLQIEICLEHTLEEKSLLICSIVRHKCLLCAISINRQLKKFKGNKKI